MPRITTKKSNKDLRREYRLRFLTALFLAIVFAVLVTVILMLPSYTLLNVYEKSYTQPPTGKEESNVQQMNFQYNQKLEGVSELSSEVRNQESVHLKIIEKLNSYTNNTILFNTVELGGSEQETSVILRGIANTREDLLAFESNVKGDTSFEGFKIPIDTLTKQKDISFNVSFIYHEK